MAGGDRHAVGARMELWAVLVLVVLKQGLGCDFDRLHEHANTHRVLGQLLGHGEFEPVTYSCGQVMRNVSLLDEDTLRGINELLVRHGHSLCGRDSSERRAGATALLSRRMIIFPPTATCSGTQPE